LEVVSKCKYLGKIRETDKAHNKIEIGILSGSYF
jgi:hypothetical protein